MAQRRHHYERAFERYLREKRIPYVAVDEARKALLPEGAPLRVSVEQPRVAGAEELAGVIAGDEPSAVATATARQVALKSFDFVLYGTHGNSLVDVKGRKVMRRARAAENEDAPDGGSRRRSRESAGPGAGRLESWVTHEDVESLTIWQSLFGAGFASAFVFVYWCDEQPPDGLFQEIMEFQGRWYALRAITLDSYVTAMRTRSQRWRTVDLARPDFDRLSQPFAEGWVHR